MAASMVLSGHRPRKQLAEKAARVMQLLDNDVDDSDLKLWSCGSASTGSPDGSQSRSHGIALRVDTLGRHVSTIHHSASTSVFESAPLSTVRQSSSGGGVSGQATKANRHGENHQHGAADATHNAAGAASSAAARAPPFSRPGLKSSSVSSVAASNVPPSRRLQHYGTWHGESLDRVPIPRVHTVGSVVAARSSHHLTPREAPRLQLHHAATGPGGQRAEPASCAPHNPSPRSSSGTAVIHGTRKSRSDPDFGAVDTRPVLQPPLRQLSSDLGTRGPTRTLSRQIRRPSDDDVAEPFVMRNHHASPVDQRLPAIATSANDINLCGQRFAWVCEAREERRRRATQEQPTAEFLRLVGRQRAALRPPHSPDNTFPSLEDGFFRLPARCQHAEIQLQEEDYRGGDAGGADGGGTPPLSRWRSHSLAEAHRTHNLDRCPAPSHGGAGVHVQRVEGMVGARENTPWVGEDEDWGTVQAAPWEEDGEGEDVEATRGWQGDVEGASLERGGFERHGSMLTQVQRAALVPGLRDGPLRYQTREVDSFQQSAAAFDSLKGSKQQSRPPGRPDSQRSSENDDTGGVRGSESKGSSKSREKPKSKLQRSLSEDDEEEEQAKVRAEPYSHQPSPRSSGAPKSRSDPHFVAVDTRPVLHTPQQQPSSDLGARGPTRTLSRQIRRAPDDDDDLGEPFVTRNHHASPVDHSRERRDTRGPAGPGAIYDQFPASSTVGRADRAERAERGRRCAAAQAYSPFDASSSPTSPSAASPRFPCSIPSPRHNPVTSPAACQQSPRQLLASTSVGSGSPAPARGERKGGDGRHRSSQQLSSCDSWDNSEPIGHDDPMLQISPSPRSQRGFSGRQHAEFQSDSEEEEDCRDADGGGTRPLSRWRSHSLAEDPIAEDPTARRVHTLDRRPAPSASLADCRRPRRSYDERSARHTRGGLHGGAGVDVRRSREKIGAGENARWKGEDSSESGEEDLEAMGEWQREVREAGLERGENERRGPTLKKMQGGMESHQTREAVCDSPEDRKQQSRPAGRNEGSILCGDAAAGGVKGCDIKEVPKSKPKSKLQRSLSDDDEEDERAEKEVKEREEARAKLLKERREATRSVKQPVKKVLPRKASK
ncbi:unnamed protein product [Closterium sp. Naga37s-1]|nr:unnamed protein product [Closterium sp. Naga37s-1]